MSRVVYLRHLGVPCALSSSQVLPGGPGRAAPRLSLWGTDADATTSPREIVVQTPSGMRTLPCDRPTFGSFSEADAAPMSELLQGSLGLPHVVGVVRRDAELVWLVDLNRWQGSC